MNRFISDLLLRQIPLDDRIHIMESIIIIQAEQKSTDFK